jgi:hypothetical protein
MTKVGGIKEVQQLPDLHQRDDGWAHSDGKGFIFIREKIDQLAQWT